MEQINYGYWIISLPQRHGEVSECFSCTGSRGLLKGFCYKKRHFDLLSSVFAWKNVLIQLGLVSTLGQKSTFLNTDEQLTAV